MLLKQNPGGDNTIWMRCIMLSVKYGAPHPLPVAMVILTDPQPVSVLYLHWMNSLIPTSSKVRCKIGILTESGISYQTQVSLICPSHKIYTLGTHILNEYLAFVHCICQTLQLIQFGSSNWDTNFSLLTVLWLMKYSHQCYLICKSSSTFTLHPILEIPQNPRQALKYKYEVLTGK